MYDREKILGKTKLNPEQTRIFRGGLGLCLYLAQDRPDIQEAVRILSISSGSPTVRALSALKHLACYLKGTQTMVFLFQTVAWEMYFKIMGVMLMSQRRSVLHSPWNAFVVVIGQDAR